MRTFKIFGLVMLLGVMLSACNSINAGVSFSGGGKMVSVQKGAAYSLCVRAVNATPHTLVFQPAYDWAQGTGITTVVDPGSWGQNCVQKRHGSYRKDLVISMVSESGDPVANVYIEPDLDRYGSAVGNFGITVSGHDRFDCHVDLSTRQRGRYHRDRTDCDVDRIRY